MFKNIKLLNLACISVKYSWATSRVSTKLLLNVSETVSVSIIRVGGGKWWRERRYPKRWIETPHLTRLIAREDFTVLSHRESFKSYLA
jgi:hypothetical protein